MTFYTIPSIKAEDLAAIQSGEKSYADVVGGTENTPRKARKKRTGLERLTNPYEWEIQRAEVKFLRHNLAENYIVRASSPENRGGIDAGGVARRNGQVAGWPDVDVIGDGHLWVIENKAIGGHLRAVQKEMHERIKRAGIKLLPVCTSPRQAAFWLLENGARFRIVPQDWMFDARGFPA